MYKRFSSVVTEGTTFNVMHFVNSANVYSGLKLYKHVKKGIFFVKRKTSIITWSTPICHTNAQAQINCVKYCTNYIAGKN